MKKRIFLADDSITIQKVVELTFSEEDYDVVCVSNGAAAMQRIGEASPDIALLDVIMPDRSGYEICAHTKKDKDLAWMPVLLLTGAEGDLWRPSTMELGKCFSGTVEMKKDLSLTGLNLPNSTGQQEEAYDRPVIEFFDKALR